MPSDSKTTDDLAWTEIARFYFECADRLPLGFEKAEALQKAERALSYCSNPLTTKMQILGTVNV